MLEGIDGQLPATVLQPIGTRDESLKATRSELFEPPERAATEPVGASARISPSTRYIVSPSGGTATSSEARLEVLSGSSTSSDSIRMRSDHPLRLVLANGARRVRRLDPEVLGQLREDARRDVADERPVSEQAEVDLGLVRRPELGHLGDGRRVPLALARESRDAGLDPAERARVADVVVGGTQICGSMSP